MEGSPPRAQPVPSQPPARPVSAEAFLQAICVAWGHLQPAERKAIRACCRAGRLQHDRMLRELRLSLGKRTPQQDGLALGPPLPAPTQVLATLQAAVGRGARPQLLEMWFQDASDEQREAQLLAALAACSCCPLSRLELGGAVPLSGAVAEAVEACCPQLGCLGLELRRHSRPAAVDWSPEEADAYHLGCVQLLTLCGPRLRELHLLGVHRWQPMSYMALRRCTALFRLEMQVGWSGNVFDSSLETAAEAARLESRIYSAVAQLRTLQSLHLTTANLDPTAGSPEALRPHATCVARLSALTDLTSLYLNLPNYYEHHGDSWERQQQDGEQHGAWVEVREAHRTSLLSALRAMPQLQHLDCPTLWLRPAELPAALTALTSLTLGGLLPPRTAGHPLSRGEAGRWVALPQGLQELVLQQGISPRALAELQPPPAPFHLDVSVISFGMSDVLIDGRLRPEAVAAVGPAVRNLVACRSQVDDGPHRICVTEDGSPCLLLPREDSPNGHMEWILQLQGLDVFKKLELESISLNTADLCCLGQVLPGLKGLQLQQCYFPLAALLGMRPHMLQLTHLVLDLQCLHDITDTVLGSVAQLLCRPQPGAQQQLAYLECYGCPSVLEVGDWERSVLADLEAGFGVTGVVVTFLW